MELTFGLTLQEILQNIVRGFDKRRLGGRLKRPYVEAGESIPLKLWLPPYALTEILFFSCSNQGSFLVRVSASFAHWRKDQIQPFPLVQNVSCLPFHKRSTVASCIYPIRYSRGRGKGHAGRTPKTDPSSRPLKSRI